jgi:hypothetical protein
MNPLSRQIGLALMGLTLTLSASACSSAVSSPPPDARTANQSPQADGKALTGGQLPPLCSLITSAMVGSAFHGQTPDGGANTGGAPVGRNECDFSFIGSPVVPGAGVGIKAYDDESVDQFGPMEGGKTTYPAGVLPVPQVAPGAYISGQYLYMPYNRRVWPARTTVIQIERFGEAKTTDTDAGLISLAEALAAKL